MILTSQHRERQQPPAGQAPRMADTVASGEQYTCARNALDSIQNCEYRSREVRGAYSSFKSLPVGEAYCQLPGRCVSSMG